MGDAEISFKAFIRVHYMPFELIPEMPDGCCYRPRSRIS
jgi:hypothetical protein